MAEQENSDLIDEIGEVLAGMHVPRKAIRAVTNGLGKDPTGSGRPTGDGIPMAGGIAPDGGILADGLRTDRGTSISGFSGDSGVPPADAPSTDMHPGGAPPQDGRTPLHRLVTVADTSGNAPTAPELTKVGDINVHTSSLKIDSTTVDITSLHLGKGEVEILDVDSGGKHFEVIDIKDGDKEKVIVVDPDAHDQGKQIDNDPGGPDGLDGGLPGSDLLGDSNVPLSPRTPVEGLVRSGEVGRPLRKLADTSGGAGDPGSSPPGGGDAPEPILAKARHVMMAPAAPPGKAPGQPDGGDGSAPPNGGGVPAPAPPEGDGKPGSGGDAPGPVPASPRKVMVAALPPPEDVPGKPHGGDGHGSAPPDGGGKPDGGKGDGDKGDGGKGDGGKGDGGKGDGDKGDGGKGDGDKGDGGKGGADKGDGGKDGGGKDDKESPEERQQKAANQGNDVPGKGKVTKIDISYLNQVEKKLRDLAGLVEHSKERQLLVGFVGDGTPYSDTSKTMPDSPQATPPPLDGSGGGDTKLLAGNESWGPAKAFKTAFDATALDVVNHMNWLSGFLGQMADDISEQAQSFSEAEQHNGMTAQDLAGMFGNMPEIGNSQVPGTSDPAALLNSILHNPSA